MIDQLEALDVNSTKQWVLYRGSETSKPLVLFVHGGPGSPLMMFSRAFDDVFIKDFIVVHWDQRRSGKSFSKDVPLETLTLDQLVQDGLVITEHLKKKFGKSQIILVGHSWGSIVASHMVKSRPSDFSNFVSVGTVTDMSAADLIKYDFISNKLNTEPNPRALLDFEKLGKPPYTTFEHVVLMSRLVTKYGGLLHNLSIDEINGAVAKTKEYSSEELETQGRAMKVVFDAFSSLLRTYKAKDWISTLEVPVVFVQGQYDLPAPANLTEEFFNNLNAPQGKKIVLFQESAHFPMYEEPHKFLEVLKSLNRQD